MRRLIDDLSPVHKEIVDLVYYQERSVAEASEILGVPENTVKTRMFYARKQLARLFAEAGIDRGWP
jgi:RNA polymerase sigma-70 factor (ECF subfamily)